MKKIIAISFVAALFAACNNPEADTTNTEAVDTVNTSTTNTTTTTTYSPAEGDVTYRNGRVMVWRNGDWVATDDDVTLDNGVVVYRNGEVKKGDKVVVLKEGETVDRSGNFFDKTGAAIENAWDATKEGAKKVGHAVEKGAQKVKEKAKKAIHDDDKDN
jgi:hypothetical protein